MKTTIDYRPLKELLSNKDNWCQGSYVKTAQGKVTTFDSEDAARFCLSGAVVKIYRRSKIERTAVWYIFTHVMFRIQQIINDMTGHSLCITDFNDTKSFADVKAVLDKLPDEETITLTTYEKNKD